MSHDVAALKKAKDVRGLIRVLRRGDPPEQQEAAKTLGLMRSERAVRALARSLKRRDAALQVFAAEALGRIGGPKAIRRLAKALRHTDSAVNQAAALALGQTSDPRAIDPLCEALAGGDRHGLVGVAAQALGMIRDPGLVHPLSAALPRVGPRTIMVIHTLTETDNEYALQAMTTFVASEPSPVCRPWLDAMAGRILKERTGSPSPRRAAMPIESVRTKHRDGLESGTGPLERPG
ncbi:MAG: HEAT repeat domain-containing protein [Planctomycetes bacterium]|jgi:hypothetical protein|nr:HEAT repeat domain-containing protein [Planctomycetota bacterium]